MRGFIAALALTGALWGQDKPKAPSTAEAAQQIRQIQTKLLGPAGNGDWEAEQAQREKDFERVKEIVSSFVVARIEASPGSGGHPRRAPRSGGLTRAPVCVPG
jgi:hypothetical protein